MKIYEVKESHKGGSKTMAFFQEKSTALNYAEECKKVANDGLEKPYWNYRVYEHECY